MYPSIKLMNNFKNSLQELEIRKKVKYIHSIISSINTLVENLLQDQKLKVQLQKLLTVCCVLDCSILS